MYKTREPTHTRHGGKDDRKLDNHTVPDRPLNTTKSRDHVRTQISAPSIVPQSGRVSGPKGRLQPRPPQHPGQQARDQSRNLNRNRSRSQPISRLSPIDPQSTLPTNAGLIRSNARHFKPPLGLPWDTHSCAYDSLFPILLHIWKNTTNRKVFDNMNISNLFKHFHSKIDQTEFIHIRNQTRAKLNHINANMFPVGALDTGIQDLVNYFLISEEEFMMKFSVCKNEWCANSVCGTTWTESITSSFLYYTIDHPAGTTLNKLYIKFCNDVIEPRKASGKRKLVTLSEWWRYAIRTSFLKCPNCEYTLSSKDPELKLLPPIIGIQVPGSFFMIDHEFHFPTRQISYILVGVIYGSRDHYTCRLIDFNTRDVWYSNGIQNSGRFEFQRKLKYLTQDELYQYSREIELEDTSYKRQANAHAAIYVSKQLLLA